MNKNQKNPPTEVLGCNRCGYRVPEGETTLRKGQPCPNRRKFTDGARYTGIYQHLYAGRENLEPTRVPMCLHGTLRYIRVNSL